MKLIIGLFVIIEVGCNDSKENQEPKVDVEKLQINIKE